MTWLPAGLAVAVAWAAGGGVVACLWPRRTALPVLTWLALAGVIGPAAVGAALLTAGGIGLPPAVSVRLLTAIAIGALAIGIVRRRPLPASPRPPIVLVVALALAIGWCGWVSSRTHLGWDGTVVWYNKARILAATGGTMPAATLADPTRSWTAPDYPLHVPLAMAWVRLWQPREDERTMKVLPTAWCGAILLLVGAAVLGGTGSGARAAVAVIVVASMPRLLIGEGSFTSGYGDGPMAGALVAFVWLAGRSRYGATPGWQPLLAVVGVVLAATKQEGLVAVLSGALVVAWCASHRQAVRARVGFLWPALAVSLAWQAWTIAHGAPAGMAYEWPGLAGAWQRLFPIVRAYAREVTDVSTWGLFWPAMGTILLSRARDDGRRALAIVGLAACVSACAFVWSDWPDVALHLQVTVPRLIACSVPSLVVVAFGAFGSEIDPLSPPNG